MSHSRPLYDVLGVDSKASEQDISRAYRRLALKYHPDRNPDGAEQFKTLSNAYAVLSNSEKRALYDVSGVVSGVDDSVDERSLQQRSTEMERELHCFFESYANSAEERSDIVKGYEKSKGNFRKMVREYLLFDNGKDTEVQRLHKVTLGLIQDGKLTKTDLWDRTTTVFSIRKVEKEMAAERELAAAALQEMGLSSSHGGPGTELMELQALMQQRNQASWSKMMAGMEAKYLGQPSRKSKSSHKRSRAA